MAKHVCQPYTASRVGWSSRDDERCVPRLRQSVCICSCHSVKKNMVRAFSYFARGDAARGYSQGIGVS
jgi:hypothetical protein